MNAAIKILFKVITTILVKACAEEVFEYVIFWLLRKAAEQSKTHFDDELVNKIKLLYDAKELEANE